MDVGGDERCLPQRESEIVGQTLGCVEALVDHEVRALGIVDEPLVRIAVATEDEAQPVPVQSVAVDARDGDRVDVMLEERDGRDAVELVRGSQE